MKSWSTSLLLTDSATASLDYEIQAGTLAFADGELSQTITINIIDDSVHEGDESFSVTLSNVQGNNASLGDAFSTDVGVQDDDPAPSSGAISLSQSDVFVNENAGVASLQLQRTGGSIGEVSVHYDTIDGTATASVDYTAGSGTVLFADGEVQKTIDASDNRQRRFQFRQKFQCVALQRDRWRSFDRTICRANYNRE